MLVPLSLLDFIERAEVVYGDRIGLIDEPDVAGGGLGERTYAEVAAMARSLAAALDARDVPEGARVAVLSPNAARFIVALFGVSAYGRVLVPINYRLNRAEVAYILEHSGTQVLLIDPDYVDLATGTDVEHVFVLGTDTDADLFLRQDAQPRFRVEDENATASINYTSGTTARPKGVELTHRNCYLNATIFGVHVSVTDRDVYLHTLPTFHCNGWGMPYIVSSMGVRQVIIRKIDGEEILRRIDEHGVTLLNGAPAVVSAILDAANARADRGERVPGRDRVRIVVAGAPPPSRTIERVETDLGWEFIQIYGLTETSPLLTVNRATQEWDELTPADRATRLARAGVPVIGVQLSTGQGGQILARSNHVFAGYWEQSAETAAALEGGWFNTGDGGELDGPYLTITDRLKDVIITGGENVSSIEVEDCLYQHPEVADAAVVGVPDERWGETIKALVTLTDGAEADEAALIDHCRERLAHYKCPTSVEFRSSLPRTATGKLQKFRLREDFWAGHERRVH